MASEPRASERGPRRKGCKGMQVLKLVDIKLNSRVADYADLSANCFRFRQMAGETAGPEA